MGKGRDKRRKNKRGESKEKRPKDREAGESDEDIDSILEDYIRTNEELKKVELSAEMTTGPTPRANACIVVSPLNSAEAFFFGGEYSDGVRNWYYGDFYKYFFDKQVWKLIACKQGPRPRSSHQMVACSNNKLLLFGGEFGTPNDSKFLHYRDCWLLDPKTLCWDELSGTLPPPRSGHRMVSWKNFCIMFGGFHDEGKQTRYLDDLWVFDCHTAIWNRVAVKGERPSARSGFVFAPCEEGVFLHGGYHMTHDSKDVGIGKCLTDTWILRMPVNDVDGARWEKLKVQNAMSPRSGCSFHTVKNILYVFGGIVDVDLGDEYIHGVCQNEVYCLDLSKRLSWRRLEIDGPSPVGRFNAMVASNNKYMFVYGGIVEVGDKDIFLDDIWRLHINPPRNWTCIKQLGVIIPEPDPTLSDPEEAEDDSYTASDTSEDDTTSSEEGDQQLPRPHEGESMKEYYQRTQQLFMEAVKLQGNESSEKQLRKEAFLMAEDCYRQFSEILK